MAFLDNPIAKELLQMAENGELENYTFNNYIFYYNFFAQDLKRYQFKMWENSYNDGYVINFTDRGYQPLPAKMLNKYFNEFKKAVASLPNVKSIEEYKLGTYTLGRRDSIQPYLINSFGARWNGRNASDFHVADKYIKIIYYDTKQETKPKGQSWV